MSRSGKLFLRLLLAERFPGRAARVALVKKWPSVSARPSI